MEKKLISISVVAVVLLGGIIAYSKYGGVIPNIKDPKNPITQTG